MGETTNEEENEVPMKKEIKYCIRKISEEILKKNVNI